MDSWGFNHGRGATRGWQDIANHEHKQTILSLRTMLLRQASCQTPWRQVLGSLDPTPTRECKDTYRGNLYNHLEVRWRPTTIPSREYLNREGSTFLLRCCCTHPICIQEGRIPQTLRRPQSSEPSYNPKQVPPTTHPWVAQHNKWQKAVYKVGREECIQPDKDSSRRRVEDSLLYQARTIRVYSNTIQPDQHSCIISRDDRYNL